MTSNNGRYRTTTAAMHATPSTATGTSSVVLTPRTSPNSSE